MSTGNATLRFWHPPRARRENQKRRRSPVLCLLNPPRAHAQLIEGSFLLFSVEVNIFTLVENNPSWLLPLLRSRVTDALLALLYLHPDRDYSLTEAGRAAVSPLGVKHAATHRPPADRQAATTPG